MTPSRIRLFATTMSTCVLVPLFAFLSPSDSHAALAIVAPVAASSDMGAGFGTDLVNTINGAGLSAVDLDATHAATISPNSWVSSAGVLTGQVTFDLGGLFEIAGFSFWNQNGGGPNTDGLNGINGVQILWSTDGAAFSPVPGAPTAFALQPGVDVLPEKVQFDPVDATHVRFQILSNHGDPTRTGFGEILFGVPEPSRALLCGLALGLAMLRRRRTIAIA